MKRKILSHVAAIAIGVGLCMYFDKEVHQIQDKVEYRDRTRTIVKEIVVEQPDGTKITERTTDKEAKIDKSRVRNESKPTKKNWGVGVKYDLFTVQPVWSIEVDRRIIGDVYVSAFGRTDGILGVGVKVMF